MARKKSSFHRQTLMMMAVAVVFSIGSLSWMTSGGRYAAENPLPPDCGVSVAGVRQLPNTPIDLRDVQIRLNVIGDCDIKYYLAPTWDPLASLALRVNPHANPIAQQSCGDTTTAVNMRICLWRGPSITVPAFPATASQPEIPPRVDPGPRWITVSPATSDGHFPSIGNTLMFSFDPHGFSGNKYFVRYAPAIEAGRADFPANTVVQNAPAQSSFIPSTTNVELSRDNTTWTSTLPGITRASAGGFLTLAATTTAPLGQYWIRYNFNQVKAFTVVPPIPPPPPPANCIVRYNGAELASREIMRIPINSPLPVTLEGSCGDAYLGALNFNSANAITAAMSQSNFFTATRVGSQISISTRFPPAPLTAEESLYVRNQFSNSYIVIVLKVAGPSDPPGPPPVVPCELRQGANVIAIGADTPIPDVGPVSTLTVTMSPSCGEVRLRNDNLDNLDNLAEGVPILTGTDEPTNNGMNLARNGNTLTVTYLGMTPGNQLNITVANTVAGGPVNAYSFTYRGGLLNQPAVPCTVLSGLRDQVNLIPPTAEPLIGRVRLAGDCNGQISLSVPTGNMTLGNGAAASVTDGTFTVRWTADPTYIRISASDAAPVPTAGVIIIGALEYLLEVATPNDPGIQGHCCTAQENICLAMGAALEPGGPIGRDRCNDDHGGTWFPLHAGDVQQQDLLTCNNMCAPGPPPPPAPVRTYFCDATRRSNATPPANSLKQQGHCSLAPPGGRPGNQVHNGTFTRPTVGVFDTGFLTKQACDDFCGYYYINYYSDLSLRGSFTPARDRPTQWGFNSPYAFGCVNQKVNIYGPPAKKTLCEEGGDEDVLTSFNAALDAGAGRYTGLLPPYCGVLTAGQKTNMTRGRNALGPALVPCRNVLEFMNGDQRNWVATQLWGTQVASTNLRNQAGRREDGAYNSFAACWNALPYWTQWHTVPCSGNNSYYHPLRNP